MAASESCEPASGFADVGDEGQKGAASDRQPPTEQSTVEVVYYTDPLCAWSWALEPQWRRLRYEYGDQIQCRYRMVGLVPRWDRFHDDVHSVSRPAQMAPLWMQISQATGSSLDSQLWTLDPPASSVPACMAVKAAERQGPWAAEAYLRRLREAAMLQCRNIARSDVLAEVAEEAASDLPPHLAIDIQQWKDALQDDATRAALRDDLQQVRYYAIDRFPAIQFRKPGGRAIACVGHREYATLRDALHHVAPDIQPRREVTFHDYAAYWGRLTRQELSEALQIESVACADLVQQATRHGELTGVKLVC